MQKKKQGISLIVLVITIIVMIILATTVIISLNNNGIIGKASEAVDKTNEREVQELASMAWANAYMDGAKTKEEFQTAVNKALEDNNIDKKDYGIVVTTSGVTVAKGWLQTKDRTVVKGDTVLEIGDYVNYVSGVEGYNDEKGWQVLGAENGELLLMSARDITSKNFNDEKTLESAKQAYENGISELNDLCKPYGKGAYATGARSITVEDVDRVTGYDKTQYAKGTIHEYGNIVTYSYNGTNKPSYLGTNGVSGTLSREHSSGFYWYDLNNVYHNVSANDLTSNSTGVITADNVEAKIKSTYYYYVASSATDLQTVAPNAYNMLFGSSDEINYWLGSSFVFADPDCTKFGLHRVGYGTVLGNYFVYSTGVWGNVRIGVRAVVSFDSTVNCVGSSSAGWSIQ